MKTDTTLASGVSHTLTAFYVTFFIVIVMFNVNNLWVQCESQSVYAAYYVGMRKLSKQLLIRQFPCKDDITFLVNPTICFFGQS